MRGTAIRLGGAAALVVVGTLVGGGNGSAEAAGSTDTETASGSGSASDDSQPQMPTDADLEAFADCMRDHGVDAEVHTFSPHVHTGVQPEGQPTGTDFFGFGVFSDAAAGPETSGSAIGGADASGSGFSIGLSVTGGDPDALDAADRACRDLLGELIAPPEGGLPALPNLTPDQEAQLERDQRAFDECLTDHGVALPERHELPASDDASSGSMAVPFEITVDDALTKAFEQCAPGSIVLDDGRATMSVGAADAIVLAAPRN